VQSKTQGALEKGVLVGNKKEKRDFLARTEEGILLIR